MRDGEVPCIVGIGLAEVMSTFLSDPPEFIPSRQHMPSTDPDLLPIKVRNSVIHGTGAFASRALRGGEVLGRYTGRVYTASEVAEREWDPALTFVFGLSDGSVIDGAQGGNATRHINHSCSPNCVAFEIDSESGELWIQVEALRRIRAGAELFLDYSLDPGGSPHEGFGCRCGSSRCRGTLLAIPQAA